MGKKRGGQEVHQNKIKCENISNLQLQVTHCPPISRNQEKRDTLEWKRNGCPKRYQITHYPISTHVLKLILKKSSILL